jgi:hydrogenase-4 component F
MLLILVLLPLIPAVAAGLWGWRPWIGWLGVGTSGILVVAGGFLAARVANDGPQRFETLLRADALSVFMVILIGSVALLASWFSVPYLETELTHRLNTRGQATLYAILINVFIATLVFAVLADNIGVMWVAIEGTTIASAFLVGHRRTQHSLEASWKYVILGSVGIVLAFLGTVLVAYAAAHTHSGAEPSLSWSSLVAVGHRLDPAVMRVAVVLLFLGYGTKAGLAPMHTWLPDAYNQAPAPISALSSGALLPVAFYAIFRVRVLANLSVGPDFPRVLLIVAGLLSLAVATSLIIAQRDYMRLLAYSSIEHMGIVALAAAIGTPLALSAALLHLLGHGIGKSVAFFGSGEIALSEGSTRIGDVHGLATRRPVIGVPFGLALLGLLGLPPFVLFATEIAITREGFAVGLGWVMAIAALLLLVVFGAVLVHAKQMLLGAPDGTAHGVVTGRAFAGPLILGLAMFAALGISIWPIEQLLHASARILAF